MAVTDKHIYIGYDLCNTHSQVSYYMMGMNGPVSLSTKLGGSNYLIPTVMYRKPGGQWLYGDEAVAAKDNREGVFIDDILNHALKEDSFEIDGELISFYTCLEIFVRKTINLIGIARGTTEDKRKIVFTVRTLDEPMVKLLERLSAHIAQEKDTIIFQSHRDSIFNYILYQRKELWTKDVMLFDYGPENFTCYRLRTEKKRIPNIVYIEETEEASLVGLPDDEKGQPFNTIISRYLGAGDHVSAVYLTGVEYNDKWLKGSLPIICRNRRAFIGQNLFAEGACCKAISPEEERSDYLYLGGARLSVNVGLMAIEEGKEEYIPLLTAGGNWYESQGQTDVILDNTTSIEFAIRSLSGDSEEKRSFEITGLPNRPNKTTRLRIILKPSAVNVINISVEDMGFGEFFRRTGKIWNFSMEY